MMASVDPSLADKLKSSPTAHERVLVLFDYLRQRGETFYDEAVTQMQHALQCAHLARASDGTPEQVTAALLHDLGHFLMDENDDQSSFLKDDWYHETVAADYLQPYMSEAVTVPIRLHVPAKRYLCTTDETYINGLSRASQRSFHLQGGKMTAEEVAEFEQSPHCASAVLLRRWDDGAKVANLSVPALDAYRTCVEHCFVRRD